MKKAEMITLYRDENYEMEQVKKLKEALSRIKQAVEVFETKTGEPMQLENFEKFMRRPKELSKSIMQAKTQIPNGLNAAKYLEMLDYPDVSGIETLLSHEYCSPIFFKWENGKPVLTENADKTINAKTIIISPEGFELWGTMQLFIDAYNKLKDANHAFGAMINPSQINTLCSPVYCENGSKLIGWKPDPVKFSNYFK